MLKDQLFKTSGLRIDNCLLGPGKSPGLSRNTPRVRLKVEYLSLYRYTLHAGNRGNINKWTTSRFRCGSQLYMATVRFFPLPLNEKSETKPYNFKILMLKKMTTDASKPVARYFNLPNRSTRARQLAVFPSPRKHRKP